MVDGRSLMAAMALAMLPGCTLLSAPISASGDGTLANCPSVKSANAWINRQPSTDETGAKLIVSLRLNELQKWSAFPINDVPSTDLRLDLRPGGEGYDGIVGYREPIKTTPRKRVSILCNGQMIGEVAEIHSVY